MPLLTIRRKLKEWVGRYLPAEILGTLSAMAGAFSVYHLSHSVFGAAVAGALSEAVGFYAYFIFKDGRRYYAKHQPHHRLRRWRLTIQHTTRDMFIEFGPAELLDSLLLRPLLMYLGPQLVHRLGLGMFLGKITADLAFYTLAAAGYELKRSWLKIKTGEDTTTS